MKTPSVFGEVLHIFLALRIIFSPPIHHTITARDGERTKGESPKTSLFDFILKTPRVLGVFVSYISCPSHYFFTPPPAIQLASGMAKALRRGGGGGGGTLGYLTT